MGPFSSWAHSWRITRYHPFLLSVQPRSTQGGWRFRYRFHRASRNRNQILLGSSPTVFFSRAFLSGYSSLLAALFAIILNWAWTMAQHGKEEVRRESFYRNQRTGSWPEDREEWEPDILPRPRWPLLELSGMWIFSTRVRKSSWCAMQPCVQKNHRWQWRRPLTLCVWEEVGLGGDLERGGESSTTLCPAAWSFIFYREI